MVFLCMAAVGVAWAVGSRLDLGEFLAGFIYLWNTFCMDTGGQHTWDYHGEQDKWGSAGYTNIILIVGISACVTDENAFAANPNETNRTLYP